MNKNEAQENAKVMLAYAEGKIIQAKLKTACNVDSHWENIKGLLIPENLVENLKQSSHA